MKQLSVLLIIIFYCPFTAFCGTDSIAVQNEFYSKYLDPEKLTVIASFDGSKSLIRWQEILDFAKENDIRYTFFISGVDFLSNAEKDNYIYPVNTSKKGISDIGFGGSSEDVIKRKDFVFRALKEGHDIQCHLNGHFKAAKWEKTVWINEFQEFKRLCNFLPQPVHHIRFPNLEMNKNVFGVMAEHQIHSITSVLDNGYEQFKRITIPYNNSTFTFPEYPIPRLTIDKTKIISMDYNFYLYEQQHKNKQRNSEQEMIQCYMKEIEKCFSEKRPFFISHHFINWNKGAYWNAMKELLTQIKTKYPVKFITVSELYSLLSNPVVAGTD